MTLDAYCADLANRARALFLRTWVRCAVRQINRTFDEWERRRCL